MKKTLTIVALMLVASATAFAQSKVYLTREISPESLVKIYKALGVPAKGRVAVKMSTGEGSNPNYLKPELVKDLVFEVDGTIVECNTAYGNGPADKKDERNTSENHWKVIERHGFTKYFPVDIMDEYDEIRIPVKDQTHIKFDIVGGHMANYDFMIALNHFKGHPMGGYGGALKNLSIGCASSGRIPREYGCSSPGRRELLPEAGGHHLYQCDEQHVDRLRLRGSSCACEARRLRHPRLYRPSGSRSGLHRHHQSAEGHG